tara:strand:+ start:2215 stop:3795 length:1581 start_codon:yes stop_codon:yes gene_type:complete
MKEIDKFPTIDDVHEVLSDLTGLFDDRNKLLGTMFREDKYKEFLLAENMQQLAEADKRDDSANGRIKKDLANGYEVLKAKTTMQKFANFISPGAIPQMDLTTTEDFKDDDYEEEEAPVEKEAPEKGDKGDKGDDGEDGGLLQTAQDLTPGNISGIDKLDNIPGASQNPGLKLAEGGAVSPSPMMNSLNPSAQRPESKSGVKTLESLGLVGKKNVASELTEDLGLEEYKKALSDAMALPLKAVAAGLAGLMDKVDVPGGEGAAVEGQISKIGQTFGVPVPKKKKKNRLLNFVKGGGLLGMGMRALMPKRKKKGPQTEEEAMAQANAYAAEVQQLSDPHGSEETMEDYENKGGPSLAPGYLGGGIGGASHEPVAPDQLSNQGDTKIDMMKNSISNIAQGAKNIFKKTAPGAAISATTSVLNKILGGVQPADKGSQYESQDINALTNQVVQQNEQMVNNQTQMQIGGVAGSEGEADSTKAIMDAIAKMSTSDLGITEADPLPPAPLKPSKHLIHSIAIVDGGQTPHDII